MSHALGRHVAAVTVAAATALSAACTSGGDEVAAPSPTPSAAPSATTPPPEPVVGDVEVQVRSVASEPVVLIGGEAPPIDERAIERLAGDVADWLDEHLTDLQEGEGGNLDAVAATGLIASGDAAIVETVTTALASPERPVADARYALLVAATSRPEWLRATVITESREGEVATAQFVFVPGPGGPVLIAAGPEDAA